MCLRHHFEPGSGLLYNFSTRVQANQITKFATTRILMFIIVVYILRMPTLL